MSRTLRRDPFPPCRCRQGHSGQGEVGDVPRRFTQELCHGERLLGQPRSIHVAVSPDHQRVIWYAYSPRRALHYYDADDGVARTVVEGWCGRSLLWFAEDGLAASSREGDLPAGWAKFEHSAYPEPRRPDTRERVGDHLSLALSCDKESYELHEPIQLTMFAL